jgi:Wzt C-terminal domain
VIREYATASTRTRSKRNGDVEIENARFVGETINAITTKPGASLVIRVTYRIRQRLENVTFGMLLHRSTDLLTVYDGNFTLDDLGLTSVAAGTRMVVDFPVRANLVRGQYHFEFHVYHNATNEFLSTLTPAGLLTIEETRTFGGVADLDVTPVLAGLSASGDRPQDAIVHSERDAAAEVR